ncbi:hypothetical protein ABFS82_03G069900 [Erythranthe guttata]|uniref:Uncharacterized protein n=1 Tax=Erythranthe guttata TaxID=4155 RepID=A0A022RG95_ERYGU|nr:PREDICTED: uncharacterized protein LOC105956374 [Erythranthe guttata]EYU38808.1 hypothetical protein MIMGU_mgv1a016310mg [Erythranthe guttata]|eukprot:XP_012835678.1 PREDICTED: uncharacterized protein LOC105956374 [Erythranthe guttata]
MGGVTRWKDETLGSISAAPPLPLVVFFGIFMMLMFLAAYSEFKEKVERSRMEFRFALMLLPVAAILVVNMMLLRRRLWSYIVGARRPVYGAAADEGSSPWGLMLVLALLLVMVYYQKSFQSAWFRL